jgi:acetyltransferase-like isoleucine patch superfamily enzyme
MLSARRLYEHLLQSLISLESAGSRPGTSSYLRLFCLRAMGVKVSPPIWIAQDTWFLNPHKLTLGQRVGIGEGSKIMCHAPIIIGDDFLGASGLYINSGTHDINTLVPSVSTIKIGNRVWCGMRVTICSGVSIGDDVVIGAGAVVTKSLPSGYLAYGVPAKPVRKLERVHIDGLWSPFDELNLLDKIYRKAGLFKFADKNR